MLGIFFLSIIKDFTPPYHAQILKAQQMLKSGEILLAMQHYEYMMQRHIPTSIRKKIHYQLGEMYSIHHGDSKKSLEHFLKYKELVDTPQEYVNVEEKIAEIYFSYQKEFKKALECYDHLVKFRPKLEKYEFYLFRLGLTYLELLEYQKAKDILLQLVPRFKNESHYYLGRMYFQLHEYDTSIKYLSLFLSISDKGESHLKTLIVDGKFLLANAYETIENLDMAYEIYYSLLKSYPNPQIIKNRLQTLYDRRVAQKR